MAIGSVCLGANIVEKPVTLDNTKDGVEHIFSVNLQDLPAYVQSLRDVYVGLGTPLVRMQLSEGDLEKRRIFSVSVVTARDLPAGHILRTEDLTFARAGWGLEPEYLDTLVGAELMEALPDGHVLQWKHVLGAHSKVTAGHP